MQPLEVLKRYWGYDAFRECQSEIINSVLDGNDTIGLLPTGGGKSVTFQIPAMMLPGVTVVITPLISLMKDQVDNLRSKNIPASCLHSGMTLAEQTLVYDRLDANRTKLLYISPERLASETFIDRLKQWQISLVVVDEAHCISQWGYDFRPSYLRINVVREIFQEVPILALTATATKAVVKDIAEKLELHHPVLFKRSFARDNINYIVRPTEVKEDEMMHILQNTAGTSIIYVRSRRRTESLAEIIRDYGISAEAYHAGLDPDEKESRQDRWRNNETRVIVATNAFGMGIDKPDVRLVIHYDLPSSLEEYYQEAGRAGRDGLESYAVVLASKYDKAQLKRRLTTQFPPRDFIKTVYEKLGNFLEVPVGGGYGCTYSCDFDRFCINFNLDPRTTASALSLLTRSEMIFYGDDPAPFARAMIILDKRSLYNIHLDTHSEKVLNIMLRYYPGIFADLVSINENDIATASQISANDVHQAILAMARQHILQYIPRRLGAYVHYTTSRELPKYVVIPKTVYEDQLERAEARMKAIRDYAFDNSSCRVSRMLTYFGEENSAPCGKCDYCREQRKKANSADSKKTIDEMVDNILQSYPQGISVNEICKIYPNISAEIIENMRKRVDNGSVKLINNAFKQK